MLIIFLDVCRHYIRNKRIGMHEKVKLCRECVPALLSLEGRENLSIPSTFNDQVREMVAQYGRRHSRYDIAKGVDVNELFRSEFSKPMKEILNDRLGFSK